MTEKFLNKIDKNKVLGIIPARSGSKGIKDKNIISLCNFPLISYSIIAAKLSKNIDRVIVSTDSEKYAEISKKYGAEIPFLRPIEISNDNSSDLQFLQHAIHWFFENEDKIPEYIAHIRITHPIRDIKIVDQAITTFLNNKDATSLRSAFITPHTPYKYLRKTNDGKYFKSFVSGMSVDETNSARQSFPDSYTPDGYIDIYRSTFIIENNLMYGDKVLAFETPIGIDIDNKEELKLTENYLKNNYNEIYNYLKNNYNYQAKHV